MNSIGNMSLKWMFLHIPQINVITGHLVRQVNKVCMTIYKSDHYIC